MTKQIMYDHLLVDSWLITMNHRKIGQAETPDSQLESWCSPVNTLPCQGSFSPSFKSPQDCISNIVIPVSSHYCNIAITQALSRNCRGSVVDSWLIVNSSTVDSVSGAVPPAGADKGRRSYLARPLPSLRVSWRAAQDRLLHPSARSSCPTVHTVWSSCAHYNKSRWKSKRLSHEKYFTSHTIIGRLYADCRTTQVSLLGNRNLKQRRIVMNDTQEIVTTYNFRRLEMELRGEVCIWDFYLN
jgi:hypothetical protein